MAEPFLEDLDQINAVRREIGYEGDLVAQALSHMQDECWGSPSQFTLGLGRLSAGAPMSLLLFTHHGVFTVAPVKLSKEQMDDVEDFLEIESIHGPIGPIDG